MAKANLKKNKRLGRGLESLFKIDTKVEAKSQPRVEKEKSEVKKPAKVELKSPKVKIDETKVIHDVPIEQLHANKEQPRKIFKESALSELVESIREQGILQPIVALKINETSYEIIAGERRWRAAQQCGLKVVPVILKNVSEQNKLELAIIENIQRDNLNPVEEGEAYLLLSKKYKLTQKEIALKVSKERATIANLIRITQLEERVKEMVVNSEISLGHAKVLLSIESPNVQYNLAQKAKKLNLSVRATESMVKKVLSPEDEAPGGAAVSLEFKAVEENLKKKFGSKVKIIEKNGRGKLELSFHNIDHFNRLVDGLLNTQGS